jgi:hypothetical protein
MIKEEIIEMSKVKPYNIPVMIWNEMKVVIKQIGSICKDTFTKKVDIDWAILVANEELDYIAQFASPDELGEAKSWIEEMVVFYIEKAVQNEQYECADALTRFNKQLTN